MKGSRMLARIARRLPGRPLAVYTTVTPPFLPLVDRWLAPSLRRLGLGGTLVVRVDRSDAARGNGDFRSPGFDAHLVTKMRFIAERAGQGGRPFLVTDADVVYLAPFRSEILRHLDGHDIVLAREDPHDPSRYNIGQMAIRPSPRTAAFFGRIAADLEAGAARARFPPLSPANQNHLTERLHESDLRHAPLPESFAHTWLLRHLGGPGAVALHSYHATETGADPGVTSLDRKQALLSEVTRALGLDLGPWRSGVD